MKQYAALEDKELHLTLRGKKIKFAVISDTHIGSKYQCLTHLKTFYQIAKDNGAQFVLHAGDITDGINIFRGQQNEIFLHGYDEILDYVVKHYPRDLDTYFISGNHDLDIFNRGGADIGVAIAKNHPTLHYLGQYGAYIHLNHIRIYLIHPLGSQAYALSYKIQKAVEGFSSENKPNILILGHYHSSFQALIRNVYCMHPASFQSQSPFLRRLNIFPVMGGYLIEIETDKKGIARFKSEFIPFYTPIKHDY